MAMTLIERVSTTGSGNINFASIPSTYTDLLLVTTLMSVGSGIEGPFIRINGITTSTYSFNMLRRNSTQGNDGGYTAPNAYAAPSIYSYGQTNYANYPGNGWVYFPNYTNTNIVRAWNSFAGGASNDNATSQSQLIISGITSQTTAAITSISVEGYGLAIGANSTCSLYGIS